VIAPPPSDDPGARPGSGSTTAHNFELREQRAYTAWYAGGVRLYDISSPETPELLAGWRDPTASFWTAQAATETYFIGMSERLGRGGTSLHLPGGPDHHGDLGRAASRLAPHGQR